MAAPKIRLTRRQGRDLCTAAAVVLITWLFVYSLSHMDSDRPEMFSDLPPELVMAVVSIGAALFLLKRIAWPLFMKRVQYRLQRSRARRSRRRSSTSTEASGKDS